jgi:hypothetical protein
VAADTALARQQGEGPAGLPPKLRFEDLPADLRRSVFEDRILDRPDACKEAQDALDAPEPAIVLPTSPRTQRLDRWIEPSKYGPAVGVADEPLAIDLPQKPRHTMRAQRWVEPRIASSSPRTPTAAHTTPRRVISGP